jgi:hypothetical protein
LYMQIDKEKASPLPFFRKFEALARAPVWIKAVDWSLSDIEKTDKPQASVARPLSAATTIKAIVTLEFPPEASNPRNFRTLTKKILEDFQAQFAGYEVSYTQLPDEAKESEKLEIHSGSAQDAVVKSLDVQMTIKGPLVIKETAKSAQGNQVPPAIAAPSEPAGVKP